jgi:GT2 family glycosyltransferase
LISLMMLTLDRYEITKATLEKNLVNAGNRHRFELLVCDNGSTDKRIVWAMAKARGLSYHRINSKNEGCGKAFNQLFLRSTGDHVVLLGNDIEMPRGWLEEMVKYADGVPNSGIIGMDWGHSGMPPLTQKFGIHGHWLNSKLNRVFGAWLMRRQVIREIGFFPDYYDVYGLEDSNFNERVNRAGFNSVYVPNTHFKSKHIVNDVGEKSAYRKMKDASMANNLKLLGEDIRLWEAGKTIVEPLPPERLPL